MPGKRSAGLLLYRRAPVLEVLLAHMGGPYWAGKDDGAWTVPKGEYESDEDGLAAARREFAEELGTAPPDVDYVDLGTSRTSGGKVVQIWAGEADLDAAAIVSNEFELEWPPRSGRVQTFPEIDRAAWFGPDVARAKLVASQRVFIDRLLGAL